MENNKEIKCETCGCQAFITIPNRYDVYEVIDGKMELTDSLQADGAEYEALYCRDCSTEFLSV